MKRISSLTLCLILISFISVKSIFAYTGNERDKLNATYFILGTLSDYQGRYYYVNKAFQLDRYNSSEVPLMDYIEKLAWKEFRMELITIYSAKEQDPLYEIFSKDLSIKMNSFYGSDGRIKDSIFKSPEEINSFLAGRYYRYGRKINDSIYAIHMTNSLNHRICDTLLKQTQCSFIYFRYLKNIPPQFIYYFVPSSQLKKFMGIISKQKKLLDDSFDNYMIKKMSADEAEYKKMKKELNEMEKAEITEKFKSP